MQSNPDPASGAPRRSAERRTASAAAYDGPERRSEQRRKTVDRRGAPRA